MVLSTIDANKVETTYEYGMLTLCVPKGEATKPMPLPVRVK
jgi:hypothetical protein